MGKSVASDGRTRFKYCFTHIILLQYYCLYDVLCSDLFRNEQLLLFFLLYVYYYDIRKQVSHKEHLVRLILKQCVNYL